MKLPIAVIAAGTLALGSTPAAAQNATPAVPAPANPVPAAPATGKFGLDTAIETIVADPKGKAVLDADLPNLTSHPSYDQFKSLSLSQLAPYSGGVLTDEVLKKVATDLAAIK